MKRLEGKVAIVTGGSKGSGGVTAELFAAEGACVVIGARNAGTCDSMVEKIKNSGGEAIAVSCDMSIAADRDRLVDEALKKYGDIHILVNNAATWIVEPMMEVTEEHYLTTLVLNTIAPCLLSKRVAKEMIERKHGGKIINIVSTAAFRGEPGLTTYSASKAAMISATQTIAVEWGTYGICVNAIAPGMTVTPNEARPAEVLEGIRSITPTGRLSIARDIANTALFLAGEESNNISGMTIPVDGGYNNAILPKNAPVIERVIE